MVQAAVRSFEVVFVGVVAGRRIDFAQVAEEFSIQQFQAHLGMEAFHVGVLLRLCLILRAAFGRLSRFAWFPWCAGLDVTRPDLSLEEPTLHRLGHELRAIVATNVLWFAPTADHDLLQGIDDPSCREAAGGFEQQAFPRVYSSMMDKMRPVPPSAVRSWIKS